MPNLKHFALPDLGEGLTEGEILKWLVAPGETVVVNQPIVEVETAKAAVEVPSPYAGVVRELHHAEGETVDVGSPIITFDTDPTGAPLEVPGIPASLVEHPPDDAAVEPGLIGGPAPGGRTSVLVGYGPRAGTTSRRPRKEPPAAPAGPSPAEPPPALAKPPVRKLARDLGVDLARVPATGPNGTISRADVQAAAGRAAPDGGQPGVDRRVPVRGVRKLTAEAMVASAFSAPHVTEFLSVDVTPSMELVARLRELPDFAGVRVSPLLLVARALLAAVARHPELNSSWDGPAQEIVVKDRVNLGIAAATPRGLVVPNIKDAGRLSLVELARELQRLTDLAREGRTPPADLQHGTITITNVGVFGVDSGTPILNPGESAILAFGAVRPMPWVHQGAVAVRQVTQLSLSFDHRVIDGQQGSQFLADLGALLADPVLLLARC